MMTRRQMISRTAATAGALALAGQFAPLFADEAGRRFKIGACEWSLRKSDPGSLEVAKQIGLDGVQLNLGSVGDDLHLRQPAAGAPRRRAA